MLSNTLINILRLIHPLHILSDEQEKILKELLSHYKKDMWLYPGVIKSKVNLTIENTYRIMRELTEHGYIEEYYELYCGNCHKSTGRYYKTLSELPDEYECENCGYHEVPIENAALVYKVIINE